MHWLWQTTAGILDMIEQLFVRRPHRHLRSVEAMRQRRMHAVRQHQKHGLSFGRSGCYRDELQVWTPLHEMLVRMGLANIAISASAMRAKTSPCGGCDIQETTPSRPEALPI